MQVIPFSHADRFRLFLFADRPVWEKRRVPEPGLFDVHGGVGAVEEDEKNDGVGRYYIKSYDVT